METANKNTLNFENERSRHLLFKILSKFYPVFFPVTSTNVRVSPQGFLTFSFKLFTKLL